MDNEAIVDQIVKSLSFEVVAVPQHGNQVESTSKLTPLNVKIRVRKKHGTDLRHGVLSMPKVDTKAEVQKNESPERVRLVSSDHTIMNFNMLMEAEFDKKRHNQNLNLISPGLDVNIENPKSISIDNCHTAPVLSKRTKDIFGKCKPGGCLDPPFGEDKYSYQPTYQHFLSLKDDSPKMKSSSIFKNNIFKRKKKISKSDDDFNNVDSNNMNEDDPIKSSKHKISLENFSPYSDAIITYPHPSNSTEFRKNEEKRTNRDESFKKTSSSDDRSKLSSIEDGSYFIMPKKTKKNSNQSNNSTKIHKYDTNVANNNLDIVKLRNETISENQKVVTPSTPKYSNDYRTDKSQITSQGRSYVPIPLIIPINTTNNTTLIDDETLDTDFEKTDHILKNSIVVEQNATVLEKTSPSNLNLETKEEMKSFKEKNLLQTAKKNESQEILAEQGLLDKHKDTDESKDDDDISKKIMTTVSNGNFNKTNLINDNDVISKNIMTASNQKLNKANVKDSEINPKDQINYKSQPSITSDARDLSLIDVTTSIISQTKTNSTQHLTESNSNVVYMNQELNQIFENQSEALQSDVDFRIINTTPSMESNQNKVDNLDTKEYILPNVIEEQSGFDNTEKSASDDYEQLDGSFRKKSSIHESHPNAAYMNQESNQIFENESEAPRSNEDFRETTPLMEDNQNKVNIIEYLLPNVIEEHSGPDNGEKLADDDYAQLHGSFRKKSSKDEITNYTDLLHDKYAGKIAEKYVSISEKNLDDDIKIYEKKFRESTDNTQNNKIHGNRNDTLNQLQTNNSETNIHENIINLKTKEVIQDVISPETLDTSKQDAFNESAEKNLDVTDKYYETPNKASDLSALEKQNTGSKVSDFHADEIKKAAEIKDKSSISFSEDDNVTIKGLYPYKGKISVSDQSIIGSEILTYDNTSDQPIFSRSSKDQDKSINLDNKEGKILNSEFLERDKLELKAQPEIVNVTGETNFKSDQISTDILQESWYKPSDTLQPTSILRPGLVSWKMDIALQSYVDENNEKIIKSFDSNNIPEKRVNDAFLVARCILKDDLNELKIPIDQDNNLSVKILNAKTQHKSQSEFNTKATESSDEILAKKKIKMNELDKYQHPSQPDLKDNNEIVNTQYGKKKIKIELPVIDSDENYTNNEESYKNEVNNNCNQTLSSGDIRKALNAIYEEELVPLQEIIKGLREEIDGLVAYQMKLNIQNLTPKRSKHKLMHLHKKCYCLRRL